MRTEEDGGCAAMEKERKTEAEVNKHHILRLGRGMRCEKEQEGAD